MTLYRLCFGKVRSGDGSVYAVKTPGVFGQSIWISEKGGTRIIYSTPTRIFSKSITCVEYDVSNEAGARIAKWRFLVDRRKQVEAARVDGNEISMNLLFKHRRIEEQSTALPLGVWNNKLWHVAFELDDKLTPHNIALLVIGIVSLHKSIILS